MYRDKRRYGQDPSEVKRSKQPTFYGPLKWKDPALVFTCSWSDWFIEEADAWREEAYDIIRRTPHLTYQILTKRPERIGAHWPDEAVDENFHPLPNVWLGVSVESRKYLHRIDVLREIPARLRFLSLEPLLEDLGELNLAGIGWVIVGGESGGAEARAIDMQWIRSIIAQCRAAGVPCFVKQLGANQTDQQWAQLAPELRLLITALKDPKGGKPEEWPADLRVRQMPEVTA
jgi:protein gp37